MGGVTGNLKAKLSERGDDLYETPEVAVESLLRVEKLPRVIWEPACGPGSIVRVLRAAGHTVYATDLVDYESEHQNASGIDFLMERRLPTFAVGMDPDTLAPWMRTPEAIVTNPPFKNAGEFVAHALDLCPKVIMLLRLAFMESQRRTPILDNGKLARVHVYRKRLPMMHRDGWEGRKANAGMAFAWFVWDANHSGPTELHRISWERESGGQTERGRGDGQ